MQAPLKTKQLLEDVFFFYRMELVSELTPKFLQRRWPGFGISSTTNMSFAYFWMVKSKAPCRVHSPHSQVECATGPSRRHAHSICLARPMEKGDKKGRKHALTRGGHFLDMTEFFTRATSPIVTARTPLLLGMTSTSMSNTNNNTS